MGIKLGTIVKIVRVSDAGNKYFAGELDTELIGVSGYVCQIYDEFAFLINTEEFGFIDLHVEDIEILE